MVKRKRIKKIQNITFWKPKKSNSIKFKPKHINSPFKLKQVKKPAQKIIIKQNTFWKPKSMKKKLYGIYIILLGLRIKYLKKNDQKALMDCMAKVTKYS